MPPALFFFLKIALAIWGLLWFIQILGLSVGKNFLNRAQKEVVMIEKINKLIFVKIKNFCSKKTTLKAKRQVTDGEEIFAVNMSDEVLISDSSKNYKIIVKLNPILFHFYFFFYQMRKRLKQAVNKYPNRQKVLKRC